MAGSFIQAVTFLLEGQLRFIMAPLDRDGILRDIMIDWRVIWLKPDLLLVVFSSRRSRGFACHLFWSELSKLLPLGTVAWH
jgi:hypothetical protein